MTPPTACSGSSGSTAGGPWNTPAGVTPRTLLLGVQLWYRLHGLISLEIAGAFAGMGLDAEHLMTVEIQAVTVRRPS